MVVNTRDGEGYCFCTLALGMNYCKLAEQLAISIAQYSPESTLLILTDHPSSFDNLQNVMVFYHRKKSVLGYYDKFFVIKKALSLFNTCIFLDADFRILGPVQLDKDIFEPGINAFRIRTWEWIRNEYMSSPPMRWKLDDLRIMDLLREKMNLQHDDCDIPFICEFLFAVTRCENMDSFFHTWGDLSVLCEKNRLFIHEGFSIGLAALLSGYPLYQNDFLGIKFFEPIIALQNYKKGLISQTEYNYYLSSINIIKYPDNKASRMMGIVNRLIKKITKELRFYKIKISGINYFNM